VRGIDVAVRGAAGGWLALGFALEGELSALRIPEWLAPRRADHLWRHTCFEAFVMAGAGPGYREFNFSPSGEWAAYAFQGYRQGGQAEVEPAPEIVMRRDGDRLELEAVLPPGMLPPGRSLRLGLSAVVEAAGGGLSYWALRHPPDKPDFHHRENFSLVLESP
jgi:hypothetical protein